ncbi:NADH-quinone oxidoreductase subunit N [Adhaeribacter soli]|uniref:NADH-quinone oxidoreductase subunit N n=1 Tax=Adhaeribacter soli TaxID=2607655 RepID=A0A5N1J2Z8_9BACT|nr:NADH-quinone oxidoreductase subunit N [Adhaeribacter soli]KAA9340959.1 NADH-quinone oxidoreductase subunit N [Adhaeribacter soli]
MTSIILLSVFGIINLFLGFLKSNRILMPAVVVFLAIVFGVNFIDWNQGPQTHFNNMLVIDNFSVAFAAVMVLSMLLILPFSRSYVTDENPHLAEFYSLLLFSLVGAIMMVSYENMLMLFLGIEILSIAMYVLAGSHKKQLRSNEAALKYLLMGSFATGILLFGIALIYGASGTFNISDIASFSSTQPAGLLPMMEVGVLMILIGVCFKIGAAPFHFWTPDVYEGTPTIFTAYMSTVVKTAGIAAFYKLVWSVFPGLNEFWYPTLVAITVLTLVIGNVGAAVQNSFKRMLAYSSIAHAGYLLIALTSFNDRSENAILFYALAYTVATVAAFGVLKLVSDQRGEEGYEAFNGLGKTNPLLAFSMTVAMCSLASIPLTGGFFAKFFIFGAAIDAGAVWLVVVAILMSAVSIYYYFRVVIAMYMRDAEGERIAVDPFAAFMLIVLSIFTILMGVAPGLFNNLL